MQHSSAQQVIPLGLWELDANGTILHYEPELGERALQTSAVLGKNFFSEVVPASEVQEFRDHVERFVVGSAPAHSFDLTLQFEVGDIRTRILLGRIYGSKSSAAKLILVHVRRDQASA